jgi:hypothetical protein
MGSDTINRIKREFMGSDTINPLNIVSDPIFSMTPFFRLQMSNIEAIDGNGLASPFGKLEGANRYRIEPMAKSVLAEFSDEITAYLKKAKASEIGK